MNAKKIAAPMCETGSGAGQMKLEGFEDLSSRDFTISFAAMQGSIAALLSQGQENALTAEELAGFADRQPREVRREVARERRDGAPIISGPAGFYLASTAAELRQCARALHRRAAETHKTAAALEATAAAAEGRPT